MRFLTILVLCWLPSGAVAQTLGELEDILRAHPSLAALGYETEAARELSRAATALPDPVVSFGINNLPVGDPAFDRFLPTNRAIGVRQDFPNLAGRRARASQAQARAGISEAMKKARFSALRAELIILLHERTASQQNGVSRRSVRRSTTAFPRLRLQKLAAGVRSSSV